MSAQFDLPLPAHCPLDSAVQTSRTIYRVVKSNPPTHEDFLTHQELGLAPSADACRRAAISLYSSVEKAMHRMQLSPHLGSHIACATLTPKHGRATAPNSDSGHMDWWPYRGMRDPSEFEVTPS